MTTPEPDLLPRHSTNSFGASRHRSSAKGTGGPFTALLLENDRQRESAVNALLAGMARTDTRVIRVANTQGTSLTLGRILNQAMAPGDVMPAVDDPRLLVAAIVEPRRTVARVLLLIEQAELIHPDALRSLQAMAPYFAADGQPSLRVVFVGRPAFRDLLLFEELSPLRQALAQPARQPSGPVAPPLVRIEPAPLPPAAAGLFEPVATRSGPQRWHIAGLAMAMLAAAYYVGLREPAQPIAREPPAPVREPGHATVPELPGPSAAASLPMLPPISLPPISPPPASQLPASPAPATTSAAPLPATGASPPARPPRTAGRTPSRLWDFDAFLLSSGRNPATLSEPERSALFDEFLRTREHPSPSGAIAAVPSPRIVVHVPAGSAPAEALSGRLLASLGGRSGTVEERHVMDTPSQPSIRYFHPEDAPAARRTIDWMAGAGLSWTVRDFTSYQPRPSRGTIEVWLPRQP